VLIERLAKIEKSLDAAVEAKVALEAKLSAELKEREELELKRLNRLGIKGSDRGRGQAQPRDQGLQRRWRRNAKASSLHPLDEAGYDAYKKRAHQLPAQGQRRLLTPKR
jgi:hypothetical protein